MVDMGQSQKNTTAFSVNVTYLPHATSGLLKQWLCENMKSHLCFKPTSNAPTSSSAKNGCSLA